MHKSFLITGAFIAALSVLLGAFGAHYLKNVLSIDGLQIFESAVRYQFYHAFALIIVGLLYKDFGGKYLNYSGKFFIAGIILFSGSLYILCAASTMRWIGAITPLGGLCFIVGWSLIVVGVFKTLD